jgi:MarR family transcriptional regulator, negative regulator of the multidrug operon emrRAB
MEATNCMTPDTITHYQQRAADVFASYSPDKNPAGAVAVWRLCRASALAEKAIDNEVHRPRQRSWSAYRVLGCLHVLGATDPGTLARVLDVAPPSISSLLATLERLNLITRAPDPENRRRVIVSITPAGVEAAQEALSAQTEAQARFVECLNQDEQQVMSDLLAKVLNHHWAVQGKDFSVDEREVLLTPA